MKAAGAENVRCGIGVGRGSSASPARRGDLCDVCVFEGTGDVARFDIILFILKQRSGGAPHEVGWFGLAHDTRPILTEASACA